MADLKVGDSAELILNPNKVVHSLRHEQDKQIARLLGFVDVTPGGCWIWTGATNRKGYGRFRVKRSRGKYATRLAHRLMYEVCYDHPGDLCVLHRCDNPPCVNPFHLWLGTKADNNRDMTRKRRNAIGRRNSQTKLSAQEVREIRHLYKTTPLTQKQIADQYGVSDGHVCEIVNRKKRAHVE